jgi:hypothetical protein
MPSKKKSDAPLDSFVVFIITHGRPHNVYTYETVRRAGYTGPILLLVDDLDKTLPEYQEKFGDEVVVFDKRAIAETTDKGDNFQDLRTTTHVRNAAFEVAKERGIKYFVVLDDDYTEFQYRFDARLEYRYKSIRNIDRVFAAFVRFHQRTGCASIAMAQGGDFIGGAESSTAERVALKRKCMNSFFCATDKPFRFLSRLNEDVNTYITLGVRGALFFTANQVSLVQKQTQATAGGMTETYLESGTYVKSFTTVMYQPSSAKVSTMGNKFRRIHHSISWRHTVPCILPESCKKR